MRLAVCVNLFIHCKSENAWFIVESLDKSWIVTFFGKDIDLEFEVGFLFRSALMCQRIIPLGI